MFQQQSQLTLEQTIDVLRADIERLSSGASHLFAQDLVIMLETLTREDLGEFFVGSYTNPRFPMDKRLRSEVPFPDNERRTEDFLSIVGSAYGPQTPDLIVCGVPILYGSKPGEAYALIPTSEEYATLILPIAVHKTLNHTDSARFDYRYGKLERESAMAASKLHFGIVHLPLAREDAETSWLQYQRTLPQTLYVTVVPHVRAEPMPEAITDKEHPSKPKRSLTVNLVPYTRDTASQVLQSVVECLQ